MNPQPAPDLLGAWARVVGDDARARDCWARLVERWSEPHRRYHGLAHLAAVLSIVDTYATAAADPDAVRLAAWFHDAVYDPARSDNEGRSAELAEVELPALGIPPARVAESARLVRVTRQHLYGADDRNAALLCDADLSVLGSPPAAYVDYANAIRAEYGHLPDEAFRAGRRTVLQALLSQPVLFGVPALAQVLDAPARANLAAELRLLER